MTLTLQELIDRWHAAHPDAPRTDPAKLAAAYAAWTPPVAVPTPARRPRSEESKHRARARRIGIGWQTYRKHIRDGQRWCLGHATWHPSDTFDDARGYCVRWRRAYDSARRRGITLVPGAGSRR